LELVRHHVEGQSFEPDVLLKIARIYAGQGKQEKAKEYYQQVMDASFEVGPLVGSEASEFIKTK
jgi:hypothetical protein